MTLNGPGAKPLTKSRVAAVDNKDIKNTIQLPWRGNSQAVIDILPESAYSTIDENGWQGPGGEAPIPVGFQGLGVGIPPPVFDPVNAGPISNAALPPNWSDLMEEIRALTLANPPIDLDPRLHKQGKF